MKPTSSALRKLDPFEHWDTLCGACLEDFRGLRSNDDMEIISRQEVWCEVARRGTAPLAVSDRRLGPTFVQQKHD